MSLDQNLFTLNIAPRSGEPNIVELIDSRENVHYRKERVDGPTYSFNVFDPLSDSLLATVSAPAATSKHKTIELHNPSVPVELKYTGTFTFRWTFVWEEHEFEWKREECFLIRKPDPPVLVAVTKEPPGRIKTRAVQLLDYNLNRFDIQDRKGLEIVLLSALLSFQDYSEDYHSGRREDNLSASQAALRPEQAPEVPAKPQKTGAERIAGLQRGEMNEIVVHEEGTVDEYAEYCSNLLEGDSLLFIVLRSSSPVTVPKVLQVVHQTKRIRHKAGVDDELHQYVQYDMANSSNPSERKGPRIIKLDDNAEERDRYKPPENLTVHLSKIDMPELQPKSKTKPGYESTVSDPRLGKGKEKDRNRPDDRDRKGRERESERDRKDRERREEREREKGKGRYTSEPQSAYTNTKNRTESGRPPKPSTHIPSNQVHPNQPSPSPSQLNNPGIYSAPPPMPASMPGSYPVYNSPYRNSGPPPGPPPQTLRPPQGPPPPHASSHPYPNAFYGPGPYPAPQRPTSAYGPYLGPQQPMPNQKKPANSSSLVDGLLDKLKSW